MVHKRRGGWTMVVVRMGALRRTTESGASELPRKSYSRSHLNPVPVARHEGEPGTQERAAVASELLNCLKGVFTTARVL